MRRCEDCKLALDDDARYCPKCGSSVVEGEDSGPAADRQLGTLLASANLHRVRQEWEQAVADTMEAFRLDPYSGDVASLLASIYEEHGDLEEATIWYQIALDLNPERDADAARLQRVRAQVVAGGGAKAKKIRVPGRRAVPSWLLATGGIVILFLAVFSGVMLGKQSKRAQEIRAVQPAKTSRIDTPRTPVSGQNTPGPANNGSNRSAVSSLAGGQTTGAAGAVRTPAEMAIRQAVAEADGVQKSGARIDDIIADPRQGIVTVTFSISSSGIVSRDAIVSAATSVARATFVAHAEVKYVIARCLVTAGNPSNTQMAFVADVARQSITALPENPTQEQLNAIFTSQWWNPQIK